jgi:hypothetical protein
LYVVDVVDGLDKVDMVMTTEGCDDFLKAGGFVGVFQGHPDLGVVFNTPGVLQTLVGEKEGEIVGAFQVGL